MNRKGLGQWNIRVLAACALIAGAGSMGSTCRAQNAPADLSPDVQEVLTLSRQHMDDAVITNYIISTGKSYKLSADDIIYLNNQGVSQPVISTLLKTAPAATVSAQPVAPAEPVPPAVVSTPTEPSPSAPPPVDAGSAPAAPGTVVAVPDSAAPGLAAAPSPAPIAAPPPTMDYFQAQLAPYGTWVSVPGQGLCWQPAVSVGWRPYYDGGHWVYTDAGWYWQSDYPWGDITFHYGRWVYTASGWAWVPGYEYAPAWVVWRHDDPDGYIGWAPLPPGAVLVNGAWMYNGVHVGVDFGFGLDVNYFTFVGYNHFWEPNFRLWIVPHDRVVYAYWHSGVVNHYAYDHGHFVDVGVPHDRMVVLTHNDFHATPIVDVRREEEAHNVIVRNEDIHNYHPGMAPDAHGGGGHQNYPGHNPGHDGHDNWGH
ncbi:MAG TPA: DUF6600 domain-containing protein [Pseudomonadales bacterium]|nr:DUF6600 domain-containing protein [Pseudomonadales bacterium]